MKYRFLALLSLFPFFLFGCGGGGVSDSPNVAGKENPAPPSRQISGNLFKGPVSGAVVEFIPIVNGEETSAIATGTSLSGGRFTLNVVNYDGPYILRAVGGTYKDEATGVTKALAREMRTINPSMETSREAAVTPLTHMAYRIAKKAGALSSDQIKASKAKVSSFFSLPEISYTTPVDLSSVSTGQATGIPDFTKQYSLVLSGISKLGANLNTDPAEVMEILAQDASDGIVDGKASGQSLRISTREVSANYATQGLAQAINEFATSSANNSGLSAPQDFIANLESSTGDIQEAVVQLRVSSYPALIHSTSVVLRGTVIPGGSTVTLFRDSQSLGTLIAGFDGQFSLRAPLIPDQLNQFRLEANQGASTAARRLTIREDSIPPRLILQNSLPEYLSTNSFQTQISLTDVYGLPSTIAASLDGSSISITTTQLNLTNLSEGFHFLEVRAADRLGNRTSISSAFFVDRIAPVVQLSLPRFATTTLLASVQFSETLATASFRLYPGTQASGSFSALTQSVIPLRFATQGLHTLQLSGQDFAANALNYTTQIVFDSIPPAFVSTPALPALTRNTVVPLVFTTQAADSVNLILTDPAKQTQSFQNLNTPGSVQLSNLQGIHQFEFTISDQAGNQSTYTSSILLDTIAPSAPSISPQAISTNSTSVLVTLNGESGSTLSINGSSAGVLGASTSLSLPLNQTTSFAFRLSDLAGNQSQQSVLFATHDNTPVLGSLTVSASSGGILTAGDRLSFLFNSIQNEPGASLTLSILGSNYSMFSSDSRNFRTTISLQSMQAETVLLAYTLNSRDSLQNTSSIVSSFVRTIDTILPSLQSLSFSEAPTYVGTSSSLTLNLLFSRAEPGLLLGASYQGVALSVSTTNQQNFSVTLNPAVTHPQSLNQFARFNLAISDPAGNGFTTVAISSSFIDTSPPSLNFLTNDKQGVGALKIGDQIVFSLSLNSTEPGLIVSSSYNSQTVTFTQNGAGVLYTGTHTITEFPAQPKFSGQIPQLTLSSVRDRAGNSADISLFQTPVSSAFPNNRLVGVRTSFDNERPVLAGLQWTPSRTGTLILSDSIQFLVTASSSVEGKFASTPLQVSGVFNSRSLSFSAISTLSFISTYTVDALAINTLTPPSLSISIRDGAGNESTSYTTLTTQIVDSKIETPSSVLVRSASTATRKIRGTTLSFEIGFNENPGLQRMEAVVLSRPITFYPGLSPFVWTTSTTVPAVPVLTTTLLLESLRLFESSGNVSSPRTYSLTSFRLETTPFFQSLLIDTLEPSLLSITPATSSTVLGIGKSLSFTVVPSYGNLSSLSLTSSPDLTSMRLLGYFNDIALRGSFVSTPANYSLTYTVLATHPSVGTSSRLTGVYFTDSLGRVGSVSSLISLSVTVDTSVPVIAAVTSFNSGLTMLRVSDQVVLRVVPTTSSTDAVSLTGLFNGTTLTFQTTDSGASFTATYTILSGHTDRKTTANLPSLQGLQLRDLAGNAGPVFPTTSLLHLIDANPPRLSSISFTPSNTAGQPVTFGAGTQLRWDVPILVEAETNLIGRGRYRNTTVTFSSGNGGALYSGFYTIASTPAEYSTNHQMIVTFTDSAGNTATTSTTNMGIHIDTIAPTILGLVSSPLTSNPTYLGIGQSVLFSVLASPSNTSGGIDPISSIRGEFQSSVLNFSPTSSTKTTWTAFFTVTEGMASAIGTTLYLTDVVALDNRGNQSVALSTSVTRFIDATRPVLNSVSSIGNVATNHLRIGNDILFTVTPSASSTDIANVQGVFNSQSLTFVVTGSGGNTWHATYTVLSGATDQKTATSPPQLLTTLTDFAGNSSPSVFSTNLAILFDANAPQISSLTHNSTTATTLGAYSLYNTTNSSLSFTLGVTPAETGLSVTAFYNSTAGGALALPFTANTSGSLYSASYIVRSTHNSSSTPLQLAVTLSDPFGNTATAVTTNIVSAIDAAAPILVSLTSTPIITANTVPDSGIFLKIGDALQFSVVVSSATTDIKSLTGTFNSTTLQFSSTDSINYLATYVVNEGHPTLSTTIQMSNLLAFDFSDNASNILSSSSVRRIVDATRPQTISLIVTSNTPVSYLSAGNFLQFEYTPTMQGSSLDTEGTVSASYNGVSLNWLESPSQSARYVSTYTAQTTHADQNTALQLSGLYFYDRAGNRSTTAAATVSGMNGVTVGIDISVPNILSINSSPSSTALTLIVGDSVQFLLTLSSAENNAVITSVYNGVTLSWSTTNSGQTYLSTYTVDSGHAYSTTQQLLVTMSDVVGNLDTTVSTDISWHIDGIVPSIQSLTLANLTTQSLGVGSRVTYILKATTAEASLGVFHYNGSTTSIARFPWLTSYLMSFTSTDSGSTWTTHYTMREGDAPSSGALRLTSIVLRDSSGNISSLTNSPLVSKTFDGITPTNPTVTPQFTTTDSATFSLFIQGEAGTSLYLNSSFLSNIPSGGSTSYQASLTAGIVSTFTFYVHDGVNQSGNTTAQIYRTSLAKFSKLTSSFTGLKTTNVEIQWIKESLHDQGTFYMYSRAGLGRLDFDSEIYTPMLDDLDNGEIHTFAQHPTSASSNILLLGQTGALYKSSDKGLSWSKVQSGTFSSKTIQDILFLPPSPTNVFVATNQNIYKSVDTGDSFSDFSTNGPMPNNAANRDIRSMAYDSTNSRLYTGMLGGLFYVNTGGTFWSALQTDEVDIVKIGIAPTTSQTMIVISTTNFLRTTDLLTGSPPPATWKDFTPNTTAAVSVVDLAFSTIAGEFYVASDKGIFETTNNGSVWSSPQGTGTNFTTIDYNAVSIVNANSNRLLIGSDLSLYKVIDVDQDPYSINDLSSALPPKINSMSRARGDYTSIYLSSEMWLYRYTIAGNSFSLISQLTPVSTYTASLPVPDANVIYAGSATQGISTRALDGSNVSTHSLPVNNPVTEITSILMHPVNTNVLLTGTDQFGLFHTSDAGANWATSVNGIGIQTITALGADGSRVYAGTTTGVLLANATANWTGLSFAAASCNLNSASQIHVVSNTNGVYLVGQGDLYRASNDCTIMTNLTTSNLTPSVMSSIVLTSSATTVPLIYVGTNQGLYRSRDNGSSFELMPESLKVNIYSLELMQNTTESLKIMMGTNAGAYLIEDIKID